MRRQAAQSGSKIALGLNFYLMLSWYQVQLAGFRSLHTLLADHCPDTWFRVQAVSWFQVHLTS
jgi:hypothetical protein